MKEIFNKLGLKKIFLEEKNKKNIIQNIIKLFTNIKNLIILISGVLIVYSIPAWFIMSNQSIEPFFLKF